MACSVLLSGAIPPAGAVVGVLAFLLLAALLSCAGLFALGKTLQQSDSRLTSLSGIGMQLAALGLVGVALTFFLRLFN